MHLFSIRWAVSLAVLCAVLVPAVAAEADSESCQKIPGHNGVFTGETGTWLYVGDHVIYVKNSVTVGSSTEAHTYVTSLEPFQYSGPASDFCATDLFLDPDTFGTSYGDYFCSGSTFLSAEFDAVDAESVGTEWADDSFAATEAATLPYYAAHNGKVRLARVHCSFELSL